jgi:hypothetical protein
MLGFPSMLWKKHRGWSATFRTAFSLACLLIPYVLCGSVPTQSANRPASSGHGALQFAIADFDGDSLPDLITVLEAQSRFGTRYGICELESACGCCDIEHSRQTGTQLKASRDVNDDSFPDVVITTFWTNVPVAVLVNDGAGSFTQIDAPAFQGNSATSENSGTGKADAIRDATATLFSRCFPGDCEDPDWSKSVLIAVERTLTYTFHPAATSVIDSFFERAPPAFAF